MLIWNLVFNEVIISQLQEENKKNQYRFLGLLNLNCSLFKDNYDTNYSV